MTMSIPLFLLGAGFNADAGRLVRSIEAESINLGNYSNCSYPLVRDLPAICFPSESPAIPTDAVELRLGQELAAGNKVPFERLSRELSKADHYLASRLVGWPTASNPYRKFFDDFPDSSIATFNYDGLVELALFRSNQWSPHDGFGVKVAVSQGYSAEPFEVRDSKRLVLHLHGTYMVYEYDHTSGPPDSNGVQWIEPVDVPKYAFDPHSIGAGFLPFQLYRAGLAYNPDVTSRVIAPIPHKSVGLKAAFIQDVTQRATELIAESRLLVAIGYSFASHDSKSYIRLLSALAEVEASRLVVISPDAGPTVARLRPQFPTIHWIAVEQGFADWVGAGYTGLVETV